MSFKGKGKSGQGPKREKPEFDQQIIDLARVTRVTKGGKQLSFRATVLIGDRKGRVGYGVDKGKDVQIAVEKAANQARKNIIVVPLFKQITIPHATMAKFKSAKVLLMPSPQGSGIIAGGAIRSVLEMAGVPNVSAKMIGHSSNKISNIKATFEALQSFKVRTVAVNKVVKDEVQVKNIEVVNAEDEKVRTKKRAPKKEETII